MENLSFQKNSLRRILLERRKAISQERRIEAALAAKKALQSKGSILSFSPMGSEIDLGPLNESLKKQGKLLLVPYKIDSLLEAPLEKIDCILVPGLGFDTQKYRLGYGKGHYDRFLKDLKILTIGIGFKEQLCEKPLPKEPWDVPVQELLLF